MTIYPYTVEKVHTTQICYNTHSIHTPYDVEREREREGGRIATFTSNNETDHIHNRPGETQHSAIAINSVLWKK
jgi:hypothetical protein